MEEKPMGKNGKNIDSPAYIDQNQNNNERVVEKLTKKEFERLEKFLCIHSKSPIIYHDKSNYRYVNYDENKTLRKILYGMKLIHTQHEKGFNTWIGKEKFYNFLREELKKIDSINISEEAFDSGVEKLNPLFLNIKSVFTKRRRRCNIISLNKLGFILVGLKKGEGINKNIFDKEDDN